MDNLTDQQTDEKISPLKMAISIAEDITGMSIAEMAAIGRRQKETNARAIFIEAATRLYVHPAHIATTIRRSRATVLAYISHYQARRDYDKSFRRLCDQLDKFLMGRIHDTVPCELQYQRPKPTPAKPHDTRLGFRFTAAEEARYSRVIEQAKIEAAERYVTILPN